MNRRQLILSIFAAVIIFTGFVLARFPANQALALSARFSDGMVLPNNARGTVWNGQAENLYISYNGELFDLGKTEWTLSPWALLAGKLDLQLNANAAQQRIKAHVNAGLSRVVISDAEINVDIARVLALYPLPLKLDGHAELMLQRTELDKTGITVLEGNLLVKDVIFTFQKAVTLGTYAARLSMDGSYVVADITDIDATVTAKGRVMGSLQERQYKSDLQLTPTAVADISIGQTLSMLAKQQDDGSFHIERDGRF